MNIVIMLCRKRLTKIDQIIKIISNVNDEPLNSTNNVVFLSLLQRVLSFTELSLIEERRFRRIICK